MPALLTILAVGTATTTKASHKSSSSSYTLLFIVAIFAVVYLLVIRPRQQRMRQQQKATRQLAVGDEVVTAGGIQGRLVAMDEEVAEVEVAPGVVLTLLLRAVNLRPGAAPASPTRPVDEEWPADREQRFQPGDEEPPGEEPDQHP